MITHVCDNCDTRMGAHYLELSIRVLRSRESAENADAIEQIDGEYCDACITSGKALRDLLTSLSKYHLKPGHAATA